MNFPFFIGETWRFRLFRMMGNVPNEKIPWAKIFSLIDFLIIKIYREIESPYIHEGVKKVRTLYIARAPRREVLALV